MSLGGSDLERILMSWGKGLLSFIGGQSVDIAVERDYIGRA